MHGRICYGKVGKKSLLFCNFVSINADTVRKLYLILYVLWMGGCLWPVSHRFVDAETSPKWYAAMLGAALFFCVCGAVRLCSWRKNRPRPLSYTVFSLSVLCSAVPLSLYALWQWGGFGGAASVHGVCGPFDNPAGLASALAFSLPACLFVSSSRRRWLRRVALAGLVCLMAGILATGSRAGMLSAAAVLFLHFLHAAGTRRRTLMAVGAVLLLMVSVGLYHYKKDSADGRLLIWHCTWEMVKARPWTGYGPGGFRARYMDFQADYFRSHPDSRFARLADDVKSLFNEYLGVLVMAGIPGGLLLLALVFLLYRAWRRHPGGTSRYAALCLVAIGVFSLFSYPFNYPYTWLLCLHSAGVLCFNASPSFRRERAAVPVACAFGLFMLFPHTFIRMRMEMRWAETANRSLCGMTEKMLPMYGRLYGHLGDDPFFLYNYAAELNVAGRYGESLHVATECEGMMADYFTQLLLADDCRQLGRYAEAERHLWQASFMCPNRFVPPYELFKLYGMQGDSAGMYRMRNIILNKPVKVDSPEVRRIIREMGAKNGF